MSELKYYKLRHIVSALASPDFTTGVVFDSHDEVYYKSEADKVIARHKYKRCLAMAMYCHNQREIYERDSYDWELENDAKDTLRNKANIMRKWRKRWLELAEKLKE